MDDFIGGLLFGLFLGVWFGMFAAEGEPKDEIYMRCFAELTVVDQCKTIAGLK